MTRSPILRYLLLLLLSGLLLMTSVQAEPVKLTVLLPFSNVYKDQGVEAKQGFLLGLQQEAAEQKIDWKSWIALEFLDTRVEANHTLELAKSAIADGSKAILGLVSSGIALKIQDYVLNEAQVPFILLSGTVSAKLRTTHPLFIRTTRSVPLMSIAVARWLEEHPIVSISKPRWACVHSDYVYGVGICNAFKKAYSHIGEEIGRVPVPLKTISKKKEILQLAKLEPDFAFSVFTAAECDLFMNNFYRFKLHKKIPMIVIGSCTSPRRLQAYKKTLDQYDTGIGLYSVIDYTPIADNPPNVRFVDRYKQIYNSLPDYSAMRAYDAGRLLMKALVELQGKWDGMKVVHLMKTMPYVSPRHGQRLRFDTHGDILNGAYILKTKRDGDRLLNEIIYQVPPINIDEVLK